MKIRVRELAVGCLGVLLVFSPVADSEVYKWVDKDGIVHFSDCPPPPEFEAEVIGTMPSPSEEDVQSARQSLDALLAEQEESKALREQEKLEKERQRVEAMRVAVERKRTCIFAQQNLHELLQERPVYYINEAGERVFLDDETHKAEIERMRQHIRVNCLTQ